MNLALVHLCLPWCRPKFQHCWASDTHPEFRLKDRETKDLPASSSASSKPVGRPLLFPVFQRAQGATPVHRTVYISPHPTLQHSTVAVSCGILCFSADTVRMMNVDEKLCNSRGIMYVCVCSCGYWRPLMCRRGLLCSLYSCTVH